MNEHYAQILETVSADLQAATSSLSEQIADFTQKLKEPRAKRVFPPVSSEVRAKISAAMKGRKHTEATRKLMSELKRGKTRKPFSDEWKANLSKARYAQLAERKAKPD